MSEPRQPLAPLHGAQLAIATFGVSLATFMQVLDTTIANVSVPTIAGSMGISGPVHAFYWASSTMTDLSTTYGGASWVLQIARGINDPTSPATVGEIVGWGTHTISGTGYTHAFLLVP